MAENEEENVIKFFYERSPDYRVIYVNGVHGGITSRGALKFDMFIEHVKTPNEVIHSITPDGLGPEIDRNPKNPPITRESQIGVIMTISQAKSFASWLQNHIRNFEKASEESQNEWG